MTLTYFIYNIMLLPIIYCFIISWMYILHIKFKSIEKENEKILFLITENNKHIFNELKKINLILNNHK